MTIRLGMIGCGLIARAHGIAAARAGRSIEFTCCSSRSVESAREFAKEFSVQQTYDDHRAMLANEHPDGFVIAAPPGVHKEVILDCLDSGIRFILCEKPLTLNAKEAIEVREAARAADAVVLEGFMYRYHPQIEKLRELLVAGELGNIDQVHSAVNMFDASEDGPPLPENWRRDAQLGGGILHDFLCYPIDLANLLVSSPPVRAFSRTFESPRHGTVNRLFGLIEYENGAMATVGASRLTDFSQPLFIGCAHGSVHVDTAFNPIDDTEIVICRTDGLIDQRRECVSVAVPAPVSERLIDLHVFTWQLEHFADLIDGSAAAHITLDESIVGSLVRDALIRSAESNTWCEV